jgi:hypothetical protein
MPPFKSLEGGDRQSPFFYSGENESMYKDSSKLLNQALARFLSLRDIGSTGDKRLLLFVNVLLFFVFLSVPGLSGASQTGDDLWSLSFSNLTVAEALKELTRVTGVNLYANSPPENRRLTKAYENHTIEQIIRDVFRGKNYSLIWNYGEKGLESIAIWFFEEDGSSKPTGGRADRTRGWSVERSQDHDTTRDIPEIQPRQIPRKKPSVAIRGWANRRETEAAEMDDEEIEGEDESETGEEDEVDQARPEPDEVEAAEGEDGDEHEPSEEPTEDEETSSPDTEDEAQDSSS